MIKLEMLDFILSTHLCPVHCLAQTEGADPLFFWAESNTAVSLCLGTMG